jgi:hypothetical protein
LSVINKYFASIETEGGYSDDADNNFGNSCSFLLRLTNLDCDEYSFAGCEPSIENYKDWKIWYKLNRKKLYFEDNKVKINGEAIPVKKKPVKYYKKKLKLVKKSIHCQFFEEPKYSYAIQFLVDLTNTNTNCFNLDLNKEILCEKEIRFFETWLKENQKNLYWDVKHHTVKLRKRTFSNN